MPEYNDDDFVSAVVGAQIAKVSVHTLRRWLGDGVVPSYRTPGGQLKVRVGDIRPEKLVIPNQATDPDQPAAATS